MSPATKSGWVLIGVSAVFRCSFYSHISGVKLFKHNFRSAEWQKISSCRFINGLSSPYRVVYCLNNSREDVFEMNFGKKEVLIPLSGRILFEQPSIQQTQISKNFCDKK